MQLRSKLVWIFAGYWNGVNSNGVADGAEIVFRKKFDRMKKE